MPPLLRFFIPLDTEQEEIEGYVVGKALRPRLAHWSNLSVVLGAQGIAKIEISAALGIAPYNQFKAMEKFVVNQVRLVPFRRLPQQILRFTSDFLIILFVCRAPFPSV